MADVRLIELYPASDGFLLVLQSFLLLVQFLKLETYEVFTGRRSRATVSSGTAAAGATGVMPVSGAHHLTVLLLRRLLLVMMVLLFWRQVSVMYLRLLRLLLLLLLSMIHRRVTESHRCIRRRLTNVSRYRQRNGNCKQSAITG